MATPCPKPSAKRQLSPSLAEDIEHGAKHINTKPARFQDFLIKRRRFVTTPSTYASSRHISEIPEAEPDEENWTVVSRLDDTRPSETANYGSFRPDITPPTPTKAVGKETEGSLISSPWSPDTEMRILSGQFEEIRQDSHVRPERKDHKARDGMDERPILLERTPVPRRGQVRDSTPTAFPEHIIGAGNPGARSNLHPFSDSEEDSKRRDDNGSRDHSSSLPSVSKIRSMGLPSAKPVEDLSTPPGAARQRDKKRYDRCRLTIDTVAEFGEKTREGPRNPSKTVPHTQQWERWQLRHAFTESWRTRTHKGLTRRPVRTPSSAHVRLWVE